MINRITILVITALISIMFFQNCERISPQAVFSQGSANKSMSQETESGGQPFDGKIFVLMGDTCPDETKIHARIILSSATTGNLVRENCQDIAAIELGPNDFQLHPVDSNKMTFRNQSFVAENLVNVADSYSIGGYAYWVWQDFGTPADSPETPTRSLVRIFENGVELGPRHSSEIEVRTLGQGRFKHWENGSGPALLFSSSDNTNPRTNGRKYTFIIEGP